MKKTFFCFLFLGLASGAYAQCTTFGYTTAGSSNSQISGHFQSSAVSISSTGYISDFKANFSSPSGNAMVGLYTDSGGAPFQLVCQSFLKAAANGWTTFGCNPVIVNPGNYWLGVADTNSSDKIKFDSNPVSFFYINYSFSNTLPFLPQFFTGIANVQMSIYIDLCPVAQLTPAFTPTSTPTCNAALTPGCSNQFTPTTTPTPYPVPFNTVSPKPLMGWNDYVVNPNMSAVSLEAQANAMVTTGLSACGYKYVIQDDGWASSTRTAGHLVANPALFPSGLSAYVSVIHGDGLLAGIYGAAGTEMCLMDAPGSEGFETTDATDWANDGFDYVKYDNCSNTLGLERDYYVMSNALVATGHIFFYLQNTTAGYAYYDTRFCNSSRFVADVLSGFTNVVGTVNGNEVAASYQVPNYYNDPNCLMVGVTFGAGPLSTTEAQSNFSMYCEMASPLVMTCDLTKISAASLSILSNTDAIGVDQDILCNQGVSVNSTDSGNVIVYSKILLGNNRRAVAIFNKDSSSQSCSVTFTNCGLPAGTYQVKDLWAHSWQGSFTNTYTVTVASHATTLLLVQPQSTLGTLNNFFFGNQN